MLSSPADTARFLLKDLDRWTFGQILAERAHWAMPDAAALNVAVRDYRLAILQAVLTAAGAEQQALVLAVEAERPLPAAAHAPYAEPPSAWENALATRFLERLRGLAALDAAEAPLTRFTHGQYFKYSRRVAYLLKLPNALPCLYAPAAPVPA